MHLLLFIYLFIYYVHEPSAIKNIGRQGFLIPFLGTG
jgi:hypothetical protein